MNKKGFTLVELLAVLVLLALIAILIIPNVLRTTNKTEKKAFKESIKGIIRGTEEYYASVIEGMPLDNDCPVNDVDGCLSIDDIPDDADIENLDGFTGYVIDNDGTYEVYNVTDGVYCANGKRNSLEVTNGNCN